MLYRHLHPRYWNYTWFGYPSRYDPKFSIPYAYKSPAIIYNSSNNCHKKCADKYIYVNNNSEYINKINNCINNYCY